MTFEAFVNDVHELTGCDADEVPGGYGAFGFAITNPVPVKGVISNEYYLSRLRTADGKRITWERVGSRQSPQSGKPVDLYRIFDVEETEIARLFISPYHKRVSNQAPEGFRLLSRADAEAPGPARHETTFTGSAAPTTEPAAAGPESDDREPAAAIYVTTDGEGNQEIQVLDARLLAASMSLLAAWAAVLLPDHRETRQLLADTVDSLDGFPGRMMPTRSGCWPAPPNCRRSWRMPPRRTGCSNEPPKPG
jgi:hypothetical protein